MAPFLNVRPSWVISPPGLAQHLHRLAFLAVLAQAGACARYGVVDDSTTISYGRSYDGILKNGVRLSPRGDGYWVPARWDRRGNQYGTDELITMIVRVARRLSAHTNGTLLGVADLSPRGGGKSAWHRSHQTGRDVDLLFFYKDSRGRSVNVRSMIPVDENGESRPENHRRYRGYTLDRELTWLLIKELLAEPTVDVQYLYIYAPLKTLLIEHARARGEPDELVARVEALMSQPVNSGLHDDHLHVRLYCPYSDRAFGCLDGAEALWHRVVPVYAWNVVMAGNQLLRAVSHLVTLPA